MNPFTNRQNPFKTPEATVSPTSMSERIMLRMDAVHRAMIRVEHVAQQDPAYQMQIQATPIDNGLQDNPRPTQPEQAQPQVSPLDLDAIRADIHDFTAGNGAN